MEIYFELIVEFHDRFASFRFGSPTHSKFSVTGTPLVAGLVTFCPYNQAFEIHRYKTGKFNDGNAVQLPKMIPRNHIQCFPPKLSRNRHVLSVGRDHYQSHYEDDLPQLSFLLTLIKELIWATKSLILFLVEQPSQLKYLEWPRFQSTLKTATLTLIIVALLIVVLSSVDSIPMLYVGFASKKESLIEDNEERDCLQLLTKLIFIFSKC